MKKKRSYDSGDQRSEFIQTIAPWEHIPAEHYDRCELSLMRLVSGKGCMRAKRTAFG